MMHKDWLDFESYSMGACFYEHEAKSETKFLEEASQPFKFCSWVQW